MKLFESLNIGSLSLKNRVGFPPITTGFGTENGCFTQEEIDFTVERAKGGVSIVFSDAVSIDRHHQLPVSSPLPYLDSDEQISKYARYVDAIHNNGAKACIQLYHAGRQTTITKRGGKSPVGPSAISTFLLGRIPYPDSVEMTCEEINKAIQGFVLAASRAKCAGFDAIDIDGGAGYLIQQFMSPLTNKRKDQWGGSLSNRMRFPIEIITRVREVVGKDYPLFFDLCLDEFMEGGITPDEGLEMAAILESYGINAFRIHGVTLETYDYMFPTMGSPLGTNMPLGLLLKKRLKSALVFLGQRIHDPELAERILQEGAADLVLLGRPLIADPYFVKKTAIGKKETIRKCIACNLCVDNLAYARAIRCVINPIVGFEGEFAQLPPTTSAKKVLIIGAGPAGLEAARVASLIGHEVTLVEKKNHIGGQLILAASTPDKEELINIVQYYESQLDELNIRVQLNTTIDHETIKDMNPDTVILATGARPLTPPIPGADKSFVYSAEEVLQAPSLIGNSTVVIIGGGSLGAETAEVLAIQGAEVSIIEMNSAIAVDMGIFLALKFHDRLEKLKINQITEATVQSIEDGMVRYLHKNTGPQSVEAAKVVLATGYEPDRTLESDIKELLGHDVTIIGDCQSPRKIIDAIHEGFHAARMIEDQVFL